MSYIDNIEYVYVQCQCFHPGDTIRICRDEDGLLWLEFQSWHQHNFWRRLKNAFQILFKKKPHNWSELLLTEKAAKEMATFLLKGKSE